jgi:signal transduction histidine kinase
MKKTLRILVIGDEVKRVTVCRTLLKTGLAIDFFEMSDKPSLTPNAYRVFDISRLEETTYDCIFLNSHLSNTDVVNFIHQIRDCGLKAPLVVITSLKDEAAMPLATIFDGIALIEAGATDYLQESKVSPDTLLIVLRNAIRLYSTEMQSKLVAQQLRETNELLISRNQELEAQRQQIELQNFRLSEVTRLKSQFLATISHELRTPMNAIIGFSQFLLRPKSGQLSQPQQDMVERIVNNGKSLLTLLNEILDFSKLETGQLSLKPQIFDISTAINSTVAEMTPLALAKKLSLQVKYNLQNPITYNDPMRIKQVLTNLLSNAIKFTESGEILIEIEEIPENRIAIAVHDTGIGIDNEQLKNIFEVFRQIDQTTTRKYPGTGLGLAIVKAFVDMMDGKIKVESSLGHGSAFRVELPRQVPSSKKQLQQQKSERTPFGKKHLPKQQDVFSVPSDRG